MTGSSESARSFRPPSMPESTPPSLEPRFPSLRLNDSDPVLPIVAEGCEPVVDPGKRLLRKP